MQTSIPTWYDSLETFFSRSNENDVFSKYIPEAFAEFCNRSQLNWLEIGPGDGVKTGAMLEFFKDRFSIKEGKLDILEPDQRWVNRLREEKRIENWSETVSVNVVATELPPFCESNTDPYNLITAIHVLYDSTMVQPFMRLVNRCLQTVPSCSVVVAMEDENSDFFRLRVQLQENGFKPPMSQVRQLATQFRSSGYSFRETLTEGKIFDISGFGSRQDQMDWLAMFLLGISPHQYDQIPWARRQELSDILDRAVKHEVLRIEDRIMTLSNRQ